MRGKLLSLCVLAVGLAFSSARAGAEPTPFAVSHGKGIEHAFSSSLYTPRHVVRVPVEAVQSE